MAMNRLLVFILAALPFVAEALTPSQVFEKAKDSVVVIYALNEKNESIAQGSGVIFTADKVATNCHVVKDGISFQVAHEKISVPATFFAGDADKDICILQVEKPIGTPAELGKAVELKVGVPVYAIGAPKGLELSLSDGIVSALRGSSPPLIQTTAAISKGSSGGGLFNSSGMLVGFTTLYVEDGQSLNFASPVEWLAGIKPSNKLLVRAQRSKIDWLTRASMLEERNDWQSLLKWATQWANTEANEAAAWAFIGQSQAKLYQRNKSILAFRKALSINPEFIEVWNNLGNIYGAYKQYDEALIAYRQVLLIDSEYALAWYNIGHTYIQLQRYADSITANRNAIRINQNYADAWGNLGVAYFRLNRYEDAISSYRQALSINKDYAIAWYNLGLSYAKLKNYDEAIIAYRQALVIDPESAVVWSSLAYTYYLSGDTSAALQAVKNLRPLDSAQADKLFNLIVPH